MKEQTLGPALFTYLGGFGWEIYQEVHWLGRTADIVATRRGVIYVVEMKTSASLAVLEQAWTWLPHCNMVSVAVPVVKRARTDWLFNRIAKTYGFGVFRVSTTSHQVDGSGVNENMRPAIRRKLSRPIELHEEQKTFSPAGTPSGKRWSPWRCIMAECSRFVRDNPGCTLKELVSGVAHHYSSDRSAAGSIVAWANCGRIVDVDVRRGEKGRIRFYASQGSPPGTETETEPRAGDVENE